MKFIDFHTHIYPEKVARKATLSICEFYGLESDRNGTAEELLTLGSSVGITDYAILPVAVKPDGVGHINDFIVSECAAHPEFHGFGTVHAGMAGLVEEGERIASLGLHGIKMHPDTQRFAIDDERLFPLYDAVGDRLIFVFHTGDKRYDYSSPARLRRVLDMFPHMRAIAAHLGGYSVYDEAEECLCDTNAIVDISSSLMFMPPETAVKHIRAYGADRVLFGSDYPLWNPAREVERFMQLPLTDDEREKIAHVNAEKLLGI